MPYWLMKSEPDEFSIDDLAERGQARWDGVRNYQARNFLRQMQVGERFFFYHSSCAEPGLAGIGEIVRTAYPDPTACDPQSAYHDPRCLRGENPWSAVEVVFVCRFQPLLSLRQLRTQAHQAALADLELLRKGSRLSVMPVSTAAWQVLCTLADVPPG